MTSHNRGPRKSKSSSPSEEPDSRILRGYSGAKEFGNPGPLYAKPKAYTEEEGVFEDESRKLQSPRSTAEDNHVLGQPGPLKGRAKYLQR